MMQAIRKNLMQVDRSSASHAGLLLRRFLHVAVKDTEKQHSPERSKLHRAALEAVRKLQPLYDSAFNRWISLLPGNATRETLHTAGRLIVGLGGDNVLETGLTLHHTYGVPIIPGSALKGLAAHYCDQVWGARLETDPTKLTPDNHKFRRLRQGEKRGEKGVHAETGLFHEAFFGTTDDSGHIIFHDAWISPDSLHSEGHSGLVLDVTTPHHGDYYSDKEYEALRGQRIPPTDFDDPKPVTFLSVAGAFHVAVSCDVENEAGCTWAKLAFDLLLEALREWGVGGKTSSGYGRMVLRASQPAASEAASQKTALGGADTSPSFTSTSNASTMPQPAPGPRYPRGAKISVTCIDPAAGKKKAKFQADDGFTGHIPSDQQPAVSAGQRLELWVANVSPQGYTFSTNEPIVKQKHHRDTKKGGRPR